MSEVVHVRYPVPVRYVPKGGRHERIDIHQEAMPLRLPEAARSEFHRVEIGDEFRVRDDGRLWARLEAPPELPPDGPKAIDVGTFRDWLEGRIPPFTGLNAGMLRHLYRTPLLAAGTLAHPPDFRGTRGDPLPDRALAQVRDDALASCAANVRRFVEEEVAVVGRHVYVRAATPVMSGGSGTRMLPHPRFQWGDRLGCRPDRIRELAALGLVIPRPEDLAAIADLEGSRFAAAMEDDDLHLFANGAPRQMHGEARGLLDGSLRHASAEARDAVEREVEAVRPWMVLGVVGGIGADRHEEAILRCVRLGEALRDCFGLDRRSLATRVLAYAGGYALPRLRGHDVVAAADSEALTDLGMAP